jgi:hypothetical protein
MVAVPFALAALACCACGDEGTGFAPNDAGAVDCPDCPRCGDPLFGESEISQEHRIDLVFEASIALDRSTAFAETELRRSLVRLGEVFGAPVGESAPLTDMVSTVKAAIDGAIAANVEGGLIVASRPARCFADDEAAQHAVRSCLTAAGCDAIDVELSDASFACDGICVGSCTGEITGTCTRQVAGTCDGTCTGTCALAAPGPCAGTCVGTCDGTCAGSLSTSICVGRCSGDCDGACEMPYGADCAGACGGLCTVEAAGECAGVAEGDCPGSCFGDCEGLASAPPDVASACDATSECQSRAALIGMALPRCGGASFQIRYDLAADVDDDAKAAFFAQMSAFEHELETISWVAALAAYAQAGAVEGGAVGAISAGVEDVIGTDLSGYTIVETLVPCVIPALETVAEMNAATGSAAGAIGDAAATMLTVVGG